MVASTHQKTARQNSRYFKHLICKMSRNCFIFPCYREASHTGEGGGVPKKVLAGIGLKSFKSLRKMGVKFYDIFL